MAINFSSNHEFDELIGESFYAGGGVALLEDVVHVVSSEGEGDVAILDINDSCGDDPILDTKVLECLVYRM